MLIARLRPGRSIRRTRLAWSLSLVTRFTPWIGSTRIRDWITVSSAAGPGDRRCHRIRYGIIYGLPVADRNVADPPANHPSRSTRSHHLAPNWYLEVRKNPGQDRLRPLTARVGGVDRTVCYISVEIDAAIERDRVFAEEPARVGIVVSGPVVIQPGFRVELAGRVLQRIGERASGSGQLSEGVVGIGFGE